jgi:16S rRNA (adenine1518-N6/adenine1519-N6)-dimethyltransferase
MNLASPSQVRSLLGEIGVSPRKNLGQNFLIDRNILDIIIDAAGVAKGDNVLEVGPGLGIVTEQLLLKAGHVTAVEKDERLYRFLVAKFEGEPRLELVNADILELDSEALPGFEGGMDKVVSNVPFSAGSRIIADLVMADAPPRGIVVTVQREVAARLAAEPGGRDYGLLSVWTQLRYDVDQVKAVSPNCFWPKPEVVSMIVRMVRGAEPDIDVAERKCLYGLTKHAFGHRRKQLASILSAMSMGISLGEARELLEKVGVEAKARPENLGVGEWCRLVKELRGCMGVVE